MSYIDQSLGPHERIRARAKVAWIYSVAAWLWLAAGLALSSVLYVTFPDRVASTIAAAASFAAGAAAFVYIMVPVWVTEIAVTNQRLVIKRGLIERSSEELQLWSIEEVDWEQGLIDRLFGFGHLVISGTGDEDMRLPLISNALAFRKALQHAIADARPMRRSELGDEAG